MKKEYLVLDITAEMIEAVWKEFEREHPGLTARDMAPEEFSARLLQKIKASAHKEVMDT